MPQARLLAATIGHGDRPIDELGDCLRRGAVDILIDIRSWPRSRRFPHFDRESLASSLASRGVDYGWWGREFGGLRRSAADARERHGALADEGLRAFADWMTTPRFQSAADALERLCTAHRPALLCAERDPRQCHRWLLADYLVRVRGFEIHHLEGQPGQATHHALSPAARVVEAGLRYDRGMSERLAFDEGDDP